MRTIRYHSIILLVFALSSIFVFSSCEEDDLDSGSKYDIVGVWSGHYYMPTGTRVDGQYQFKSDHTGTYERSWKSNYSYASFAWTIKGGTIRCEGAVADSDGAREWKRTITLDNNGTSFYDGGITYSKSY